jgi:hypothetical protein
MNAYFRPNTADGRQISEIPCSLSPFAENFERRLVRLGLHSQPTSDSFRSVRLSVNADGSVRLDAQDMGKSVEDVLGADEYEFWMDVPAAALRKLVFALLREKYLGQSRAVDEFRAFCKKAEVEHEWDSWI